MWGVNIFLLISGWYGIKSIKKGIVRLVVDCFVYGLFACVLYTCIAEHSLSIHDIYNSVKFTNGWYVPNYMYLLLLSPIIESSLKNVSLRNLRIWIFLIIICQIYFGYILGFVDKSGYSAVNFVFLYYIGRYMRLELGEQGNKNRHYKFISLTVWIASGAILGIVFIVFAKLGHPIKSIRWWSYNNPFVLIGSISIFVFFAYVKIQKVWINYFATSVLGIYLVLSNSLITDYRNSFAYNVFNLGSYPLLFTYAVLLVLLIGFVILVINKIRQPLLNVVYRILKRKNWL